ncbi:MAG: hypothetical protein QXL00_03395, partial [Conexivisphaerales archaeon]
FQQPSMVKNPLPMRSNGGLSNYTLSLVTGRALALPATLIVEKLVSVYLVPSNIYVDLAMSLRCLLSSFT